MTQPTQNNNGVMSLPIPVNIAQSKNTTKPGVYTMGKKHYESVDWLGNVRVTYTDKKSWQQNKFALNVSSSQDYYPFGSVMEGRGKDSVNYRYGFNDKEKVNEIYGAGNAYDFGARIYDSRTGKWFSLDPRESEYVSFTSYGFALNTPICAIDPDGEVIVFINGNHYGDGARVEYWRQYRKEIVWDRKPSQWLDPGEYHYEYVETYAFDKEVMRQFNDFKAIYRDGAVGGYAPFNGMSAKKRYQAGYDAAMEDAKMLFENLDDGETIKIVAHSMGAAYAKGYILGLQQYMKENDIKNVKIEIEVDFAPYQPDSDYNAAIPGVPTFQASHSNDKIAGNNKMQGAERLDTSKDDDQGHSIFSFKNSVRQLGDLLKKTREKQQ